MNDDEATKIVEKIRKALGDEEFKELDDKCAKRWGFHLSWMILNVDKEEIIT